MNFLLYLHVPITDIGKATGRQAYSGMHEVIEAIRIKINTFSFCHSHVF